MSDEIMERLRKTPLPFAEFLGLELVSATPECVEARLPVRKELCTVPDIMHGGAIMALADTLGAIGTVLNLDRGASTTTVESKTNFLAAIPLGETAHAVSTPVHRGRKLMVWQTRISRDGGKLAAIVTQTQLVL